MGVWGWVLTWPISDTREIREKPEVGFDSMVRIIGMNYETMPVKCRE